jgi:AcrR family transcriptional regulator
LSKKNDIMHTAEKLFYEEGFHRTGVARIASKAGTTQRTLYKHFPSKEDLVLCIMGERESRYFQDFARLARLNTSHFHALIPFYSLLNWLEKEASHGCFYMHALAEYKGKHSRIENFVLEHKQRMRVDLTQRLQHDGISDDDLVSILIILLEGVTAISAIGSPRENCLQVIKQAEWIIKQSAKIKHNQ